MASEDLETRHQHNAKLIEVSSNKQSVKYYRRLTSCGFTHHDVFQHNFIVYLLAINTFDETLVTAGLTLNEKFTMYVRKKLSYGIIDLIRDHDVLPRREQQLLNNPETSQDVRDHIFAVFPVQGMQSLDETIHTQASPFGSDLLTLHDIVPAETSLEEELIERDRVRALYKALMLFPKGARKFIYLVFIKQVKIGALADILELDDSRISQYKTIVRDLYFETVKVAYEGDKKCLRAMQVRVTRETSSWVVFKKLQTLLTQRVMRSLVNKYSKNHSTVENILPGSYF